MESHRYAVPLTTMMSKDTSYFFYAADSESDIKRTDTVPVTSYSVSLNRNYWIETKNVIILGHNSKCHDIMQGFVSFCNEWDYKDSIYSILHVIVLDDPENLEKMNFMFRESYRIENRRFPESAQPENSYARYGRSQ